MLQQSVTAATNPTQQLFAQGQQLLHTDIDQRNKRKINKDNEFSSIESPPQKKLQLQDIPCLSNNQPQLFDRDNLSQDRRSTPPPKHPDYSDPINLKAVTESAVAKLEYSKDIMTKSIEK